MPNPMAETDEIVPDADADTDTEAAASDAEAQVAEDEITVTGSDKVEPEESAEAADAPSPEDAPAPAEPAAAPPPVTTVVEKRGPGFVPLVLGGGIAAAIGWAVATFTTPPPPPGVEPARVETLEQDLRGIENRFAELVIPPAADLTPLETAQADLVARFDDLGIQLEDISTRLEALELAGGQEDGSAGAEVLASLRGEIAALQAATQGAVDQLSAAINALPSRIQALEARAADLVDADDQLSTAINALPSRIEALEARAADLVDAEAEAEAALRRAAQNEVAIAIRDGLPFAEAAQTLGDLPDILAANAEAGLPPKETLADGFGTLARAALAAARDAGETDANLGSLASSLLNIRSTEPREGDDPDAVLSRVEAAVRAGDLQTALTEIDALPPEAAAALSDWSAQARTRVEAEAALQDYLEG